MEPVIVIVIAFILLVGVVALVVGPGKGWARSWLPKPRPRSAEMALPAATATSPPGLAHARVSTPAPISGAFPMETPPARVESLQNAEWRRGGPAEHASGPPPIGEILIARLERIERSLAAIEDRGGDRATLEATEVRRALAGLEAQLEIETVRGEAVSERLRADLLTAITELAAHGSATTAHRTRACTELYARLAGLETALAAVTNPVLLPGEAYQPPTEFLPEAFVWDNWNEVGDRVFAFAETYSAERLHLSSELRGALSEFVTQLRHFLTGSIYPSLKTEPDTAELATMRSALDEIALALPRVREALEHEYRQG